MKMRKNKIATLEKVRDMFVLGCNLGQRYSDLVRISPENFKNAHFTIVQQRLVINVLFLLTLSEKFQEIVYCE